MGGKARTIFQVVLWGAAMWASGGAAAAAMPWLAPALGVASTIYGSWVAKEARRKAENAAAEGLEPRRAMMRSAAAAKYFVFGTAWVPSVVVGHRSPVSKDDPYFWLVLALPVAHEIHSYAAIYFGEHNLLIDANGNSTNPQFSKQITNTTIHSGIVPSNMLVPVPAHPADLADSIMQVIGNIQLGIRNPYGQTPYNPDTHQDIIKPDAYATLVAGTRNVIQIHDAAPGDHFTLTYSYTFTRAYIQAWLYHGTPTQTANAEMIYATRNDPFGIKWSETDRLQDIPYAVFKIHVDKDVFQNGLENISFLIRGMRVFDPRTGNTDWTSNPILCAREYALRACGVLAGQIDQALIEAESSVCDEPIPLPPGEPNEHPAGNEAAPKAYRYDCNIALTTEATPQENLGAILATCDGSAVPSGPTFDLRAGHYDPAIIALSVDDGDFVGAPSVIKGMARPDLFNQVRARFTNHKKTFWPLDDAPPYLSAWYAEQDRRAIPRELDLVGVVRPYTAHRLIKQILHKARQGMRVQATFNIRSFQLSPEQVVLLTVRSLGIVNKPFRVKTYKPASLDTVDIDLQEEAVESYQWDYVESPTFDPAPNSTLPLVGSVPAIQQLRAVTNVDAAAFGPNGELVPQCQVLWAQVTNILVLNGGHIEIRHKRKQDTGWTESPLIVPTATEYRFPCRRGDVLIIEARLANAIARGPWTKIEKIADDTPTEHLSGNLLYNAGFEFVDQYESEFFPKAFPGWGDRQYESSNSAAYPVYFSSNVGTGQKLYGSMYPHFFGDVQDLEIDPLYLGVVTYTDLGQGGTSGTPYSRLLSTKMPVTPGDRVIASVRARSMFSRSWITIQFYNAQGQYFQGWQSEDVPWEGIVYAQEDPQDLREFGRTHVFAPVPEGAVSARLALYNQRSQYASTGVRATVFWYQPYFGRASDGQVTLPNWTKI